MQQFGIDISKWQGNFDFNSAVNEGVTFAIIKGGGGDDGLYTDSKFKRNYNAAKKASLPIGVYWFSCATTIEEAEKEAEYFYTNVLKNRQFELPVFIDVEHSDMLKLDKNTLTEIIKTWCSYIEEKNMWVGIYSSLHIFSNNVNDTELHRYTHWVAQWTESCTYTPSDILGIWQFGGDTNMLRSNKISGVVCDQNYMYADFPTIIKSLGLNGFAKEISSTPQPENKPSKTSEEIADEVIKGKWGVGNDRKKRLSDAGYSYDEVQSIVDRLLSEKNPLPSVTVKAGDLVKMSADAVIFGTNNPFADFAYRTPLYVRELNGVRAVISTVPEGPITGAVEAKYLSKYPT